MHIRGKQRYWGYCVPAIKSALVRFQVLAPRTGFTNGATSEGKRIYFGGFAKQGYGSELNAKMRRNPPNT